jgi:hypothetical protein
MEMSSERSEEPGHNPGMASKAFLTHNELNPWSGSKACSADLEMPLVKQAGQAEWTEGLGSRDSAPTPSAPGTALGLCSHLSSRTVVVSSGSIMEAHSLGA